MSTHAERLRAEEWAATEVALVDPEDHGLCDWAKMRRQEMTIEDILACFTLSSPFCTITALRRLLKSRRLDRWVDWVAAHAAGKGILVITMVFILDPPYVERRGPFRGRQWVLRSAAAANQAVIISRLQDLGASDTGVALYAAAEHNAVEAILELLRPGVVAVLDTLDCAVCQGHVEAFDVLHARLRTCFVPADKTYMSWFSDACIKGKYDLALRMWGEMRDLKGAVDSDLRWCVRSALTLGQPLLIRETLSHAPPFAAAEQDKMMRRLLRLVKTGPDDHEARWLVMCWAIFGPSVFASFRSPGQAAIVFAMVVCLCDGFLALTQNVPPCWTRATQALRFFGILRRLPLELQMLACNLAQRIPKDLIPSKTTERALKFVLCFL